MTNDLYQNLFRLTPLLSTDLNIRFAFLFFFQLYAYENLKQRLENETPEKIAEGEEMPENPEKLKDYFDFFKKSNKPQEGKAIKERY